MAKEKKVSKYVVFQTGGHQYLAQEGQLLDMEKVDLPAGDSIEFNEVLLLVEGEEVKIGQPFVEKVVVQAEVVKQFKGEKIRGFFYRSSSNKSRRRYGHRQNLTQVRIKEIKI